MGQIVTKSEQELGHRRSIPFSLFIHFQNSLLQIHSLADMGLVQILPARKECR